MLGHILDQGMSTIFLGTCSFLNKFLTVFMCQTFTMSARQGECKKCAKTCRCPHIVPWFETVIIRLTDLPLEQERAVFCSVQYQYLQTFSWHKFGGWTGEHRDADESSYVLRLCVDDLSEQIQTFTELEISFLKIVEPM